MVKFNYVNGQCMTLNGPLNFNNNHIEYKRYQRISRASYLFASPRLIASATYINIGHNLYCTNYSRIFSFCALN